MIKTDILLNNRGLTLVELMIVLVLSLLLMAAVYLSFQAQSKSSNEQNQVMATQQDLRAAIDIVERDIINTGCDPLFKNTPINTIFGINGPLASTTTLTSSTTGTITISFDANGNGALDAATEQVTYVYNAGTRTLQRNGTTLVTNVTLLQFRYLDGNDIPTTTIANIRAIQVEIDMMSPDGLYPRQLTRRIELRNIRT
jgi:prepilin-type N-terminal cleavage/methylation domain-containing protein